MAELTEEELIEWCKIRRSFEVASSGSEVWGQIIDRLTSEPKAAEAPLTELQKFTIEHVTLQMAAVRAMPDTDFAEMVAHNLDHYHTAGDMRSYAFWAGVSTAMDEMVTRGMIPNHWAPDATPSPTEQPEASGEVDYLDLGRVVYFADRPTIQNTDENWYASQLGERNAAFNKAKYILSSGPFVLRAQPRPAVCDREGLQNWFRSRAKPPFATPETLAQEGFLERFKARADKAAKDDADALFASGLIAPAPTVEEMRATWRKAAGDWSALDMDSRDKNVAVPIKREDFILAAFSALFNKDQPT